VVVAVKRDPGIVEVMTWSSLSFMVVFRLLKRVLYEEIKDCLRSGTYHTLVKRCFAWLIVDSRRISPLP